MKCSWLVGLMLLVSACGGSKEIEAETSDGPESSDDEDKDLDGYTIGDGDCDDTKGSIYPGAEDVCDGQDNNCDGEIDEGGSLTFYIDYDGDGYGLDSEMFNISACEAQAGYVDNALDCDDTDPDVNPDALERCDELDNDCDGSVDEDLVATYHMDSDGDGFGDSTMPSERCEAGDGYVLDARDCDDTNAEIHPGAPELCDGIDNNCLDGIDEGLSASVYLDVDGDGYGDPGMPASGCDVSEGYVEDNTDCDDSDASVHPDAEELCDDADNDCDGAVDEDASMTFYLDYDGDGYGAPGFTMEGCTPTPGFVATDTDCNDLDASIHPDAPELCDGLDNNCNLLVDEATTDTLYVDDDGDGFGDPDTATTASTCDAVGGLITDGTDCDDTDPTVYPDADELCDGLDNDCDGDVDEDLAITLYVDGDGDGYGDASMPVVGCDDVGDLVVDSTDCDDTDATVYPDAEELCDDLDNDCDTEIDEVEACESSCGDGVLDEGEEQDPPESIFSTVDVDDLTCRWDFSEVEQLYCNGGCSWAGDLSCDDADADIFCKLRTGNPLSEASSYTVETALSAPGFPCPSGYTDVYTDRGVTETVYYTDLDILATHGPGEVVTNPVCTDP